MSLLHLLLLQKEGAANWSSETVSGYAAHLQGQMSDFLYWPESEGLIPAVSKVNIPPLSEILYEDWTEHYRDEFPDGDLESDPVISNPNYWDYRMRWDDDEKKIPFKGKIVCPTALFEDVVLVIHSYGHPRVEKTVELFDRKYWCLAYDLQRGRRNLSPRIPKILGRCHDCQTTKARRGKQPDTCEFAPVPKYPFTSFAIDVCKLLECLQKSTGKKVDYLMVIVCRQTRYVLAIPCQERGLDSKNAGSVFLDRCVHMFGLPKEFICDNASIINSEVLKELLAMSGVEQHSSVAYRPQSDGRAERAVQSIVNSLRQYLEKRGGSSKHSCLESLPLDLWALNDLPGAVTGYSPHRLLCGRDPVGWGDCLPVSLQDGAEDAGPFFGRMLHERAEIRKRLEDLHAKEFAKFLAKHPEQSFKPGNHVWVRNRTVEPPVHGKLGRVWQGCCEVLGRISPGTYRVNIRGREDIFTSWQLKPYVPYKDDQKVPLHYYRDREGLIETEDYAVERVLEDRVVREKRQWRVKFWGFPEPEFYRLLLA